MSRLADRIKAVLYVHFGLSYEEIALQNGMKINNLRVVLSRARQMIKAKYIKYTDERGKA